MTARSFTGAAQGGVGFAAGQYFFDLAHDDFLRLFECVVRVR
jgi:hypothetical protein